MNVDGIPVLLEDVAVLDEAVVDDEVEEVVDDEDVEDEEVVVVWLCVSNTAP